MKGGKKQTVLGQQLDTLFYLGYTPVLHVLRVTALKLLPVLLLSDKLLTETYIYPTSHLLLELCIKSILGMFQKVLLKKDSLYKWVQRGI